MSMRVYTTPIVRTPRIGGGVKEQYAAMARGNDFAAVLDGLYGIAAGQSQPTSVPTRTPPDDTPGTTPAGLGAVVIVDQAGSPLTGNWVWAWPSIGVPAVSHGHYVIMGTITVDIDDEPGETVSVLKLGGTRSA
jgi:hypothetical protein